MATSKESVNSLSDSLFPVLKAMINKGPPLIKIILFIKIVLSNKQY